jgi:hypothetical protein
MIRRAWLVRLYPRPWRERYGEEFAALLEESVHSPLDVLDIMLGALDAHLGIPFEGSWRSMNRVNKLRTAILLVFAGYIGFIIAGLSLVGLVDDSPAGPLMKTDLALSVAWDGVHVGAILGLLAIVIGGLPLAIMILRQALTGGRPGFRLLLVPVVAFLLWVAYGVLVVAVGLGWISLPGVLPAVSPDNFPTGNRLLLGGFMLIFILGAAASTAAVWRLLTHSEADEGTFRVLGRSTTVRLYEYAFPLSVVAALCMLVMLLSTLAFGWLAASALPDWFAGNFGILLSRTTVSFGATVSIMILSTAVAVFGVARGYVARIGPAV